MPKYCRPSLAIASSLAIAAASVAHPGHSLTGSGGAAALPSSLLAVQLVVARAKGALPSPEAIKIVAEKAASIRFTRERHAETSAMTGEEVIRRLCGSVRPEYVAALEAENGVQSFPLGTPLGETAFRTIWPACLYAEQNPAENENYTVRPDDTPSHIMRLFTGSWAVDDRLRSFMRESFNRPVAATALPVGERIAVPFITLPTFLRSRDGQAGNLISSLEELDGNGVTAETAEVGGEIIVPAKLASGATLASDEFPDCVNDGSPDYPFAPAALASSYRHARNLLATELEYPRQVVHLVIVDNGFFGVPCVTPNCRDSITNQQPFVPRFASRFFDAQQFAPGTLGPAGPGQPKPINYLNELRNPDIISGHGTHVAGLTLGGPPFEAQRDVFDFDGSSWLKLVIANLGAGRRTFPKGAENTIFNHIMKIRGRKVVNLSLTIDDDVHDGAALTLRGLMEGAHSDALFVAAAGNRGTDLLETKLYPARFGAGELPNVITVASIDSDGGISKFSNYGVLAADIAAPGCKIGSWLDASGPQVAASGTSQAAPLVSMAAALLRSIWDKKPPMLKGRLVYSGRLIADRTHRVRIASGVQLNASAAVLVRRDLVTVEAANPIPGEPPRRVTLVGKLEVLDGFECDNGIPVPQDWYDIRAFKREGPDSVLFWRPAEDAKIVSCPATLNPMLNGVPNEARMTVEHDLTDAGLIPVPIGPPRSIRVGDIRDIVMREPDPLRN